MPMRKVPPVVMAVDSSLQIKPDIGPIVVMSGYLTKRTRTINRWKQRWWQLLDNGMLLYFKNDERLKLLGEIDIAHTCYDVRLGAEKCRISFPRVAPSCCCIAFSVLKRTYYLYAPTAAEAIRWAETITKASRVLNRRVVAGVDRRQAPDPPGGPPRPPSCPPNFRINRLHLHTQASLPFSDSVEDMQSVGMSNFNSNRKFAHSVPDFLDHMCRSPSPHNISVRNHMILNSSGSILSPSESRRPSTRDSITTVNASGSNLNVHSAITSPLVATHSSNRATMFSSYGHELDSLSRMATIREDNEEGGTLPRMKRRKRVTLSSDFVREFQLLESREAHIRQKLRELDLPPRPASVSAAGYSSSYSYQPPPQLRPRQTAPFGCEYPPIHPEHVHHHPHQNYPFAAKSFEAVTCKTQPNSHPEAYKSGGPTTAVTTSGSTTSKPVPKPRKPKGAHFSSKIKTKKEPSFVRATRIVDVRPATSSPTDLENSVVVSSATVVVTNNGDHQPTASPPPRPRKDSGPPNFVPLPPRTKRESGPPNFVPTPPPVEVD